MAHISASIEFAGFSHFYCHGDGPNCEGYLNIFYCIKGGRVGAQCKDENFWLAPGKCSGNRGAPLSRETKLRWLLQSS